MRSILPLLFALGWLAGCSVDGDLAEPVEPIGAFKLGYNVVVAQGVQKVPPSRDATEQEWETALKNALDTRFGRFNGSQLYHIAVKVDAYALAIPGVPVVLSPKSALRIQVSVWDDAVGEKINAEPQVFTVLERFSSETVVGSGLTRTREEQIAQLSANAARRIEVWLRENPDWFAPRAADLLPEAPLDTVAAEVPPAAVVRPGVSPDIGDVITPAQ